MAAPPPKEPWMTPPPFYVLYDGKDPNVLPPSPPPIPPKDTKFHVLGLEVISQGEPMVPDLMTERFFSTGPAGELDYKAELRKLFQELLFLVLEMLKTLVDNPQKHAGQLMLVNKVFTNIQYLINCLRPHQARASLEHTLRQQIDSCRQSLARLRTQRVAAEDVLNTLAVALDEASAAAAKAQGDAMETDQ